MLTETCPEPSIAARPERRARPWWHASIAAGLLALTVAAIVIAAPPAPQGSAAWWTVTALLHLPFAAIVLFLVAGAVERVGFLWRGRTPRRSGTLPRDLPTVCIHVPLFNEDAVAARIIAAVGALRWPVEKLEVQILDDSTDETARIAVDTAAAALRRARGIQVTVLRRERRTGYKAGALEAGRRRTRAEFIAIFDADFMPTPDFLERCMPHFYRADGAPDPGLALVQAQWGHLNAGESALTRAQSLWVDDHHSVQMAWRSATWGFVNFTGTAGIWRASAIERAGGWRAASLVEDCELSFRHLFAGYRTAFVRDVVAPAELPSTYTAYKAQQRRWTQGWAQVQRLHLGTLAHRFETSWARRLHLLYHMCIPWQWPLWALWILVLPALIHAGHWLGVFGTTVGVAVYLLPMVVWLVLATVLASSVTPDLHPWTAARLSARLARVLPYLVLNTGMLPHQFSAFVEGAAGPMHAEFERTPKAGTLAAGSGSRALKTPSRKGSVRIHWPYVVTEAAFVVYQLAWAAQFLAAGDPWPAVGALFLAACILGVGVFYGDHAGKILFVVDRSALRRPRGRRVPATT